MADTATTPVAPRIRSLFPDLELYSPSPPSGSHHHHCNHFTVPRLRRGPMYSTYSELRESKLRRKKKEGSSPLAPVTKTLTPEKKAAPAVARSIPNFSAALRKENRSPVGWASPVVPPKGSKMAVTPPRPPPATVAASSKGGASAQRRAGGCASANRREEKRCGGSTVRKSYSCLKELKGLSGVASSAIEEEGGVPSGGREIVKKLARRYY